MRAGPVQGRLLAPLLLLVTTSATLADPGIRLSLPIDCVLGKSCHIQQYVDRAPSPERLDFGCGVLANDGHKGTDFALPNRDSMRSGISVLAAAEGIVRGLRDDMPDIDAAAPSAPELSGRECGNGVVLRHADGWETQYCHMRQGSISVEIGQTVKAGDAIGLVGMSGLATFPHLHFAVRKGTAVIDPFQPDMTATCSSNLGSGLWDQTLPYRAGGLIAVGVLDRVPAYQEIKDGLHPIALPTRRPDALVVWGFVFGGQTGDMIEIALTGPNGSFGAERFTLEKNQPFLYRAWGRKAPDGGFPNGDHSGTVRHLRDGRELDRQVVAFTLSGS